MGVHLQPRSTGKGWPSDDKVRGGASFSKQTKSRQLISNFHCSGLISSINLEKKIIRIDNAILEKETIKWEKNGVFAFLSLSIGIVLDSI